MLIRNRLLLQSSPGLTLLAISTGRTLPTFQSSCTQQKQQQHISLPNLPDCAYLSKQSRLLSLSKISICPAFNASTAQRTGSRYEKPSLERLIPKHLLRAPRDAITERSADTLMKINTSIVAYLENALRHKEFMAEKRTEFELGKRHLANIMSWDPESISQNDIDKAIRYLFPSGLFEKLARPVMRPPDEIYPKFKEAQYGLDGRPYSSFFYTGKPNYYQALYDLYVNYQKLNAIQDEMYEKQVVKPSREEQLNILDHSWISNDEMNKLFLEKIKPIEYAHLISSLETLVAHPYSAHVQDFITKYTKQKVAISSQIEILPPTYDEHGRLFAQATGKRRTISATVTVYGSGTGKFTLNETENLQHFDSMIHREQIMVPLKCSGLLGKVDIEVSCDPNAPKSSLAGAIRYALSLALRTFIDPDKVEILRVCGLLTKDRRVKERKKPGLYKARKRHPWKAR